MTNLDREATADTMATDAVPYTPAGLRAAGVDLPPSPATLGRWRLRGLRGIRIQTFLRGGRRYVTRAALAAFFEQVTQAVDGDQQRLSANNQASVSEAEKFLEEEGI